MAVDMTGLDMKDVVLFAINGRTALSLGTTNPVWSMASTLVLQASLDWTE
jgi:hypothetical protein